MFRWLRIQNKRRARVLWFTYCVLVAAIAFFIFSQELDRRAALNRAVAALAEGRQRVQAARLAYDSSAAHSRRLDTLMVEILMRERSVTPTFESVVRNAAKDAGNDSTALALAQANARMVEKDIAELRQPKLSFAKYGVGILLFLGLLLAGMTWL
jgi:hypothetical protein